MKREKFLQDSIGEIKAELVAKAQEKNKPQIYKIITSAACFILTVLIAAISPWLSDYRYMEEITFAASEILDNSYQTDIEGISGAEVTNYSWIRVPKEVELSRNLVEAEEYMPIYKYDTSKITNKLKEGYLKKYYGLAEKLSGIDRENYVLSDNASFSYYGEQKGIFASITNYGHFDIYYSAEQFGIGFNGEIAAVNYSDSEQIVLEKTEAIADYYSRLFGKKYENVTVKRNVFSNRDICVYLHNGDFYKTNLDMRFMRPASQDYIRLIFRPFHGGERLYFTDVEFHDYVFKEEMYKECIGKARTITLTEAEELLKKGFYLDLSNYGCPVCSKNDIAVDFISYEQVDLKYEMLPDGKSIPCYVFYKTVEEEADSKKIGYLRVPAVRVSGVDEYLSEYHNQH